MPPRRVQYRFVHQTALCIPGTLHKLNTSRIFVQAYSEGPNAHSLDPEIEIHPATYDIQLRFRTLTLTPLSPDGFVDAEWPPQTGTVILQAF